MNRQARRQEKFARAQRVAAVPDPIIEKVAIDLK